MMMEVAPHDASTWSRSCKQNQLAKGLFIRISTKLGSLAQRRATGLVHFSTELVDWRTVVACHEEFAYQLKSPKTGWQIKISLDK